MESINKILIIEDDKNLANLEKDYLEASDFEVVICENGKDGLQKAIYEDFDLIVLDILLPDLDGYSICREIRTKKETPILMVTANVQEIDVIRGFNVGADDYITKPFSPNELVIRVKAHIGRFQRLTSKASEKSSVTVLNFGDIKIDLTSRKIYKKEVEIFLPNKEFELLSYLAQNPNVVFSKDKLMDVIWGVDSFSETATVTVHIKKLREKLEDDQQNPKHIQTVWGVGYRFNV